MTELKKTRVAVAVGLQRHLVFTDAHFTKGLVKEVNLGKLLPTRTSPLSRKVKQ